MVVVICNAKNLHFQTSLNDPEKFLQQHPTHIVTESSHKKNQIQANTSEEPCTGISSCYYSYLIILIRPKTILRNKLPFMKRPPQIVTKALTRKVRFKQPLAENHALASVHAKTPISPQLEHIRSLQDILPFMKSPQESTSCES